MLRRGLVAIGVIELAVGLTFACSSFSAEDSPPVTADATDEDGGVGFDAIATPDSQVPDAAPNRCSTFDAAGAVQPTTGIDNYACGALHVNLGGNPQHCGWCGHACLDAQICTSGVCQPQALVTGPGGSSLQLERVDDSDIYWVDQARVPAALFRASSGQPSNQSDAGKLVEVDAAEPISTQVHGLAIEPRIYLHTFTNLYVAPFDGGPLTVFSTVSAGNEITPLVSNGGHLFQTSYEGAGTFIDFLETDAAVLSKQTGATYAYDLAVTPDGRYAFYIGRKAADAGVVDGSPATRAALFRYTVADHAVTRVAEFDAMNAAGPVLAADDESVYFPEGAAGSILRLPVDAADSTAPTVLSPGDGRMVGHIALDDTRVYWFSSKGPFGNDWDLMSVDKCGGGDFKHVSKDANQSFGVRGFRVHGTHLYWASRDTIFSVGK